MADGHPFRRVLEPVIQERLIPLGWRMRNRQDHVELLAPDGKTRVMCVAYHRPSTKSAAANSLEGPSVGWSVCDESQALPA